MANAPDYADVFGIVTKNGENGDKINLLVDMYTGVYYIATEDGALTLRVNKDGKPYVNYQRLKSPACNSRTKTVQKCKRTKYSFYSGYVQSRI